MQTTAFNAPKPGRRQMKPVAGGHLPTKNSLRDKVNLDIFWLRDESLADSANFPNPGMLAAQIVEDLRSALSQFVGIAEELGRGIEVQQIV